MLDSNFSTLTKDQVREQTDWYLSELRTFEANKGINYIIVCCHEPPFTNSRVIKPNKNVESYFANPSLQIQKPVLCFSGHSHSYERFKVHDKFFIVAGGGGGPRHKLVINPSTRRYSRTRMYNGMNHQVSFEKSAIRRKSLPISSSRARRLFRMASSSTITMTPSKNSSIGFFI